MDNNKCVIIYKDFTSDSVKTLKGEIISEDNFLITIKDSYDNISSISKSTILKIKYLKHSEVNDDE